MNTPICDFVRKYVQKNTLRLHVPGHKGVGTIEQADITEVNGADSLYEADGIIRESEQNASTLFGAHTVYSTEGSSLCIRAMLYLVCRLAAHNGKRPVIAAGRNAHKTFLSAAAVLDFDVFWLYPQEEHGYLSCPISPAVLEAALSSEKRPDAVYLTSPDYLGNMVDVAALAAVCHRHGVLLLVDNAHGAYLRFLPQSRHPIDLGADMCCDSAHKTLPVLTGGAYLHISSAAPLELSKNAKEAMALFGSTSPSYLILQSLDKANRYLADNYSGKLYNFTRSLQACKALLLQHGFSLQGDEPLKLTIAAKAYGYTGIELAAVLREQGVEIEFADPDYAVMMFTPENGNQGILWVQEALLALPRKPALSCLSPMASHPQQVMTPRQALFAESETVPASQSVGRILATATVGCPPAVPIVSSGERIPPEAVEHFTYYGITTCLVVKE